MSLEIPLLSDIKIEGNSIGLGRVISGITTTTYKYDTHLKVSGSATIINNTFMDPAETGTENMVSINNCSCVITHNKFVRGAQTIASYILNTGTRDQIITHNIFDKATINGTSEILVSGLGTSSIYDNNKNQTVYVPVQMYQFSPNVDTGSAAVTESLYYDGLSNMRDAIGFLDTATTNIQSINDSNNSFQYNINLNSLIPNNVTIKEMKFGIYGFGSPVFNSGNTASVTCTAYDKAINNYSSGTSSILDVQNIGSRLVSTVSSTYDFQTNVAAVTAATQYITLTLNSNFNTGNNLLIVNMVVNLQLTSGYFTLQISPLLIKYLV